MPDNREKARRKQLLRSFQKRERQKLRESFPAPIPRLKDLFDYLDEQLTGNDCDHTLRLTLEFIRKAELDEARTTGWLREHGGFCDCEVLANVEDVVADSAPDHERVRKSTDRVN